MARRIRLDFGNLPLVEAAVRASFASPIELTFTGISRLHDRLRDEFPAMTETDRIEVAPGVSLQYSLGPGALLGAVLTGNSLGLSITVQKQVVVARWVRQVGTTSPEYPRFAVLAETLWKATRAFQESFPSSVPPIVVTNMSYVNYLRIGHTEPVLEYFSELVHVKAVAQAKQIRKLEVSWQDANAVDVRMTLEQASALVLEETVEGFQLTTAAGLRIDGESASEPEAALDAVHYRLQEFFSALLSKKARAEWQLAEVSLGD